MAEPSEKPFSKSNSPPGDDTTQESQRKSISKRFGRYEIEKRLGQGAMGAVFLARDTQLDRQVALKTPSFSGKQAEEQIERFYREARAAGNLRHANICPVYDVGKIDGLHYITMAFVKGRTLDEYIGNKPQPQRQVALLVLKLALALQHAHERGVVHRDLKPANVMIDDKGEPSLMDFGLALQIGPSEQARVTQSGTILGTPAYMSPEQVDGDLKRIGPSTDVYSLGVMLYELLTGVLPFQGSVGAVLGQIMTQEPRAVSELLTDVDPTLETICRQMMAKRIEERYESMQAVADAILSWVQSSSSQETGTYAVATATDMRTGPFFVQRVERGQTGATAERKVTGAGKKRKAKKQQTPQPKKQPSRPALKKWALIAAVPAMLLLVLGIVWLFRAADGKRPGAEVATDVFVNPAEGQNASAGNGAPINRIPLPALKSGNEISSPVENRPSSPPIPAINIRKLWTKQFYHSSGYAAIRIMSFDFANDGQSLLIAAHGSSSGALNLWSVPEGELRLQIPLDGTVTYIATCKRNNRFTAVSHPVDSPPNRILFGVLDSSADLRNLKTPVEDLQPKNVRVEHMAINADGTRVASARVHILPDDGKRFELVLWDTKTNEILWRKQFNKFGWPHFLQFSHHGRYLLMDGFTPDARSIDGPSIVDVETGKVLRYLQVTTLGTRLDGEFLPDDTTVLIATTSGIIGRVNIDKPYLRQIWTWSNSTANNRTLTKADRANRQIKDIEVTPDGLYALTARYDGTVGCWEVATGRLLKEYDGLCDYKTTTPGFMNFELSHDGRYLATNAAKGQLNLFELTIPPDVTAEKSEP